MKIIKVHQEEIIKIVSFFLFLLLFCFVSFNWKILTTMSIKIIIIMVKKIYFNSFTLRFPQFIFLFFLSFHFKLFVFCHQVFHKRIKCALEKHENYYFFFIYFSIVCTIHRNVLRINEPPQMYI